MPETVYTDSLRLRQILFNIVGNAIKFTDAGYIEVFSHVQDGHLLIEVRDTGVGIATEQRRHLFHLFSQVDGSSTRRHAGAGLGLALCRRLAKLLGGDVYLANSVPGAGSTFVVTLPLESSPAKFESRKTRQKQKERAALKGRSVLVVDDSEDNRLLIERVLTRQGITVTMARNGLEGTQIAARQKFDAIIMDIQMPVMDGFMAARRIRERGYTNSIVALTAHAMKEDRRKCYEAGCDMYLTKPIQIEALLEVLESAFERTSAQLAAA